MRKKITLFFIFFCLFGLVLYAQDSLNVTSPGIKVEARVSTKEIPLNRTVNFIVQVEWLGETGRYEISEVENPEVRNFKIMSNSSADRREMADGMFKAIKTFEFELAPEELGMGYIEGVIIKYIDKVSGEGKHLVTNRLEVKVVDPLPEPGSRAWIYKWILAALLLIAICTVVYSWRRKKIAEEKRKAEEAAVVSIEEAYLDELKQAIPLESLDLDIKHAFSDLSKILRRYLSDKFDFSAVNEVREEIVGQLKQKGVLESHINNVEEVLSTCDIVKFSGEESDRSALERVFTLVESYISSNTELDNYKIEEA